MTKGLSEADPQVVVSPDWVDEVLLTGGNDEVCLRIPDPIDRGSLRRMVEQRQAALAEAGIRAGGSVVLRLPPSLTYVANLLASLRIGAQTILLDHRLTQYEVDKALERLAPQVVVAPEQVRGGALRTFVEVDESVSTYPGRPAPTHHAIVQLSSGSTGPSKVIGRTAADLIAEIDRYTKIDGVPLRGERVILLPSMVHVLGLVGGLFYGLHAGVELLPPERMTVDSILGTVSAQQTPATILGVPFHIGLLASTVDPPKLPQLKRMTTGGELVPEATARTFDQKFGVPLGNMWGMTEVGVIATDLFGEHRPAVLPAPGLQVREVNGELQVSRPESPYIGLSDPTRWSDGWLHTKDAGTVDPDTGLVTIKGRLDSQVSIGGLKVDLTEVEGTLAALPGVAAAVVVYDAEITAYVQADESATVESLEQGLAERLAVYKRPRSLHLLAQMPRTTTGKLVRDRTVLREAVR